MKFNKNIIYFILLFIGLINGVTWLIGVPVNIHNFIDGFVVSPLPIPFHGSEIYENYVSEKIFIVTFDDNSSKTYRPSREDSKLVNIIGGPHRNKIAYATAFSFAPSLNKELYDSVAKFTFCQKDFIQKVEGNSELKVKSVKEEIRYYPSSDKIHYWEFEVSCENR